MAPPAPLGGPIDAVLQTSSVAQTADPPGPQDRRRDLVRLATERDARVLSQVITDAVLNLPPSAWLVSDPEQRPYVLASYYAMWVELGLRAGTVHITDDHSSVAIWLPVTGDPPPLPGYPDHLYRAAGNLALRFDALHKRLSSYHPSSQHDWLAILAVAPGWQRTGVGTHLLRHHHAVLGRQSRFGYLQASNLAARDWFRNRGWSDTSAPIVAPDNGPPFFPMSRTPAPGSVPQ